MGLSKTKLASTTSTKSPTSFLVTSSSLPNSAYSSVSYSSSSSSSTSTLPDSPSSLVHIFCNLILYPLLMAIHFMLIYYLLNHCTIFAKTTIAGNSSASNNFLSTPIVSSQQQLLQLIQPFPNVSESPTTTDPTDDEFTTTEESIRNETTTQLLLEFVTKTLGPPEPLVQSKSSAVEAKHQNNTTAKLVHRTPTMANEHLNRSKIKPNVFTLKHSRNSSNFVSKLDDMNLVKSHSMKTPNFFTKFSDRDFFKQNLQQLLPPIRSILPTMPSIQNRYNAANVGLMTQTFNKHQSSQPTSLFPQIIMATNDFDFNQSNKDDDSFLFNDEDVKDFQNGINFRNSDHLGIKAMRNPNGSSLTFSNLLEFSSRSPIRSSTAYPINLANSPQQQNVLLNNIQEIINSLKIGRNESDSDTTTTTATPTSVQDIDFNFDLDNSKVQNNKTFGNSENRLKPIMIYPTLQISAVNGTGKMTSKLARLDWKKKSTNSSLPVFRPSSNKTFKNPKNGSNQIKTQEKHKFRYRLTNEKNVDLTGNSVPPIDNKSRFSQNKMNRFVHNNNNNSFGGEKRSSIKHAESTGDNVPPIDKKRYSRIKMNRFIPNFGEETRSYSTNSNLSINTLPIRTTTTTTTTTTSTTTKPKYPAYNRNEEDDGKLMAHIRELLMDMEKGYSEYKDSDMPEYASSSSNIKHNFSSSNRRNKKKKDKLRKSPYRKKLSEDEQQRQQEASDSINYGEVERILAYVNPYGRRISMPSYDYAGTDPESFNMENPRYHRSSNSVWLNSNKINLYNSDNFVPDSEKKALHLISAPSSSNVYQVYHQSKEHPLPSETQNDFTKKTSENIPINLRFGMRQNFDSGNLGDLGNSTFVDNFNNNLSNNQTKILSPDDLVANLIKMAKIPIHYNPQQSVIVKYPRARLVGSEKWRHRLVSEGSTDWIQKYQIPTGSESIIHLKNHQESKEKTFNRTKQISNIKPKHSSQSSKHVFNLGHKEPNHNQIFYDDYNNNFVGKSIKPDLNRKGSQISQPKPKLIPKNKIINNKPFAETSINRQQKPASDFRYSEIPRFVPGLPASSARHFGMPSPFRRKFIHNNHKFQRSNVFAY